MNLEKLRKAIDEIDLKILSLLNQRTKKVLDVGKIKNKQGLNHYAPLREKQVYENLLKKNKGPLPNDGLKTIYREIISTSRICEKALCIAYLGPEATFTHLAAIQKFGSAPQFVPLKSISDIFIEVEKGRADYGVVPIENSTEGAITHTLDMFVDSPLKICAEIMLEISHNLLSHTSREKIKKIYSHAQAFAQCRRWLETNLKDMALIEVSSTAEAAKIATKESTSAAIGSELAAKLYNLKILTPRIEDEINNYTRFLVIGKTIPEKSGKDKTSILFSIKDKVGALYNMLVPFAQQKINLTKIESRPSRKKAWEYVFFLDLEGHLKDIKVKKALQKLEEQCVFLKVLGSYPVEEE